MIELSINSDKSFIGAWVLSDTSICDDLINFFESSSDSAPGTIFRSSGERGVVNKNLKDSIDLGLYLDQPIAMRYRELLQEVLEEYKRKYAFSDRVDPYYIEAINLQKYPLGGGYKEWHTERVSGRADAKRHLVFMTYLNDVLDDGETEFYYQKVKIKPKKGLTVIWPPDWTHTHRGIPTPNEIKYIATGWWRFGNE